MRYPQICIYIYFFKKSQIVHQYKLKSYDICSKANNPFILSFCFYIKMPQVGKMKWRFWRPKTPLSTSTKLDHVDVTTNQLFIGLFLLFDIFTSTLLPPPSPSPKHSERIEIQVCWTQIISRSIIIA